MPTGALADLEALDATGVHGPWLDARRISIRAGLAALDGRTADALGSYADAQRRFRDLGVALDEALTAIEMATLLDPTLPEVRAAADAARDFLERVRARPFLDRLEAAMARGARTEVDARSLTSAPPSSAGRDIPDAARIHRAGHYGLQVA